MKTKMAKLLTPVGFLLAVSSSTSVLSDGAVITLTVHKNDAYSSICSRQCKTVESCFQTAKKFDTAAGEQGLIKSMTIKANGKVLLNKNYRYNQGRY